MLRDTKEKILAYANTLPPSSARAQCNLMANLTVGSHKTIANAITNDHCTISDAKRVCKLMVDAGCAKELNAKENSYGTFVFEDGSKL